MTSQTMPDNPAVQPAQEPKPSFVQKAKRWFPVIKYGVTFLAGALSGTKAGPVLAEIAKLFGGQ